MKLTGKDKRLVIYFFYDREGIVDRYVDYMLSDIKKNTDDLIVVCNGKLTQEGETIFRKFTDNIIVRDNIGFDVWAYKTALESVGYDELTNYGEVIMMNFTIMGPLYPFEEMFSVMDEKDVDFWGLTLYHSYPADPFNLIEYGYLPTHVQSHFISVRRDMLASNEFKTYWENMPMISSYEEAICWHEAIFTKKFEDFGFKWDVYVDTRDEQGKSFCPILMDPKSIILEKRCPIFKRRSFFHDYADVMECTTGEPTVELLECIKNKFDYDVDMIYENIIRLENQADMKRIMHHDYILPLNVDTDNSCDISKIKIALVMHIYFSDLIDYCYNYALSMPKHSDILITTDSVEKQQLIEEKFINNNVWKNVKVVLIENRGRDVSALLVGAKDFVFDYDYVCFMHDKKVQQLNLSIKGASFSYKCFENMLKSEMYVKNIINTFEANKRLGMLMPPPPNFAEYYPTIGWNDWGDNYTGTVELAQELGLTVKLDKKKEPIAPLGTMFWFRPKSMRLLFDKNWVYEDFPKEPNKVDGSLLHAVERIYPYIVQQEGYYPAWVMNEKFASIEVDNLYFMLRELNRAVFETYGSNRHYIVVDNVRTSEIGVLEGSRTGQLYMWSNDGYTEANSIIKTLEKNEEKFEYKNLERFGAISEFRWDPACNQCIEVNINDIEIVTELGEVIHKTIDDVRGNFTKVGDKLFFASRDPQIYVSLKRKYIVSKIVVDASISGKISDDTIRYVESRTVKFSLLKRIFRKIRRI